MPTHRHLTPEHQRTLEHIFERHDTPHVEWADLIRLVEAVGNVVEEGHGRYKLSVGGQHHVFIRPQHDRITNAAEIAALQQFLRHARMTP